jgi:hypothetical protein
MTGSGAGPAGATSCPARLFGLTEPRPIQRAAIATAPAAHAGISG